MFVFDRSLCVPYRVDQMFELVNDIASYSKFITGCISSKILERYFGELIAEMSIRKFGISVVLITRNIITEDKSIILQLVSGPFRYLFGYWCFSPMDKDHSIVRLYLKFEFSTKIFGVSYNFLLKEKISDIVESFLRRAEVIYDR
ncbi:ubiquinone-binding protein [Blochmannia endosymbiont of Colobopsis nipponica]|uniref:SRPBCC family protein n=1 Tax=Blochmannia endosymbiont of Colobopsis nipponica TaxID=2681987 RepID=UPI001783A614|nr:SRPBCC family protein [Blochmannia endosymbiont of Colobopsis nipponica]QOI10926.1 ubiquinone-binding protein [Blochmannia endosymbiont of Colobopsis nipponica]